MKTYLFCIRYKDDVDHEDLVATIKTKDIEKYLSDLCKDILDNIKGYEYQEIFRHKKDQPQILAGTWAGSEFLKAVHNDKLEELNKVAYDIIKKYNVNTNQLYLYNTKIEEWYWLSYDEYVTRFKESVKHEVVGRTYFCPEKMFGSGDLMPKEDFDQLISILKLKTYKPNEGGIKHG